MTVSGPDKVPIRQTKSGDSHFDAHKKECVYIYICDSAHAYKNYVLMYVLMHVYILS